MNLLCQATSLRVQYGTRTLLDIPRLDVYDGECIGLVGENGAGKSTLLSILYGDHAPDEGKVQRLCQAAIVRQFGAADVGFDAALHARLRAGDEHAGMSGGEMERVKIANALAKRAPFLLLDEPTTNLDFDGLKVLTDTLSCHEGAILLISHDRALLDALCTKIWSLEDAHMRVYPGNWSDFHRERERERAFSQQEYGQYRAEQARITGQLHAARDARSSVRHTPKRMGNSEARLHKNNSASEKKLERRIQNVQSRLEKLPEKQRPREETRIDLSISQGQNIVSETAVRAQGLTLYGGPKLLLRDAQFTLPTGTRTVLVGPNGCGKTTLLNALRDGRPGIRTSPGVKIGWFGQQTLDTLDANLTLLENVMRTSIQPEHAARAVLAHLNLRAGDMHKPASVLSGGERAKCALASLIVSDVNLLLLDEPANHLDLYALEALEDVLSDWAGTLALVSHDRRMIDRVAQRLLLFENGKLLSYDGNYTQWQATLTRNVEKEDEKLGQEIVRMRMASLISRIVATPEGAARDNLEAEYADLAEKLTKFPYPGKGKAPSSV